MAVEERRVRLELPAPLEIYKGLRVPAGTYIGTSKRTMRKYSGIGRTELTYHLTLTAQQMAEMGFDPDGDDSSDFDVSKLVNAGSINVL